jgi:signal transduction histidine kinase
VENPPDSGSDLDGQLMAAGGVAAVIVASKQEIFDRFVEHVRANIPAGQRAPRPLVLNTLPAFVTSLGLALSDRHHRRTATEGSSAASTHGQERAALTGYRLDDLIQEYQLLRTVVFDTLLARTTLTVQDIATINASIDQAIREATSAFLTVYDEFRGRVAATLTHDLRGPLGAAYNYVQLVQSAGASQEMRERFCAGAMRNLGRVRQMIDDLLDHSRASAGQRLQLKYEPLELGALVREVLSDLRAAHGERYVLHGREPIHGVWCGDALKRAVYNLVENATKYGDADWPVSVTLTEIQGNVNISVHNRGAPIPAEERAELFGAFRRGSADTGSRQGWGLGLTAVKEIAEAHGGSVMVESSIEEGTTFTLQVFKDAERFQASRAD